MNNLKICLIVLVAVIVGFIGYKMMGGLGALAGLGALFGTRIKTLQKDAAILEEKAVLVRSDILTIEKKEQKLRDKGVEVLDKNQEVDYWKKQ